METSLHRQLKQLYAGDDARLEVRVDGFRIDAVHAGRLIEIQHGSLAAIRRKVTRLLEEHRVVVVKPIVLRKYLLKSATKGGRVVSRRLSPKRGRPLDLFDELVYFTSVFPHRNLTLEVPLVEVEEYRYPGHGRRRRWRKNDFQVEDQKLLQVAETHRFRTAADLTRLLPKAALPSPFDTGQLAQALGAPRWFAQRIAYCLRNTGAAEEIGKTGNARLYRWLRRRAA